MRLSKRTRKDPTMTARMIKAYERELTDVLARAREQLRLSVDVSRRLAAPPANLDISNVKSKVSVILDDIVLGALVRRSDEHIAQVQAVAKVRTDQFLKAAGAGTIQGYAPSDASLAELLRERNIGALKGLTDDMGKDIARELTDGMAKGEGIDKLTARVDGAVDIGVDRARMIARTETMYAYNAVAKDRYRRAGIEYVEWLAAIAANTCERCIALDRKRFRLGTEPDCPLHPQCKCCLIPVVEAEA